MILSAVTKSSVRVMFPMELRNYLFYLKPTVRLFLIIVFVRSTFSITVSWTSAISLTILLASYLLFKSKKDEYDSDERFDITSGKLENPFKGKTGTGQLTKDQEMQIALAIENYVVYDAANTNSLKRFETIKSKSECIFSRKAKLWGSADYDESITLEENMKNIYPTFLKFTFAVMDLGLSGFLIELPGHLFGSNVEGFGKAVRSTLLTLRLEEKWRLKKQKMKNNQTKQSRHQEVEDLSKKSFLEDTNRWERRSWVFEINRITFFITTFAPFYPETNSRYNFGCDNCYILFQPELSFAVHDLPPDTPDTNWVHPVTVRDKIRKAFNDAGRYYEPPMKQLEPAVFGIVQRIFPEDEPVYWWRSNSDLDGLKLDYHFKAL